jgi:hypothetical protein
MAAHLLVLASGPSVPGLLHDVAGVAKVGVILHVIIEMDKLVATEGDDTKDNDHNRNSYLLGEFAYPMPEASYSGSEPIHLLCPILFGC